MDAPDAASAASMMSRLSQVLLLIVPMMMTSCGGDDPAPVRLDVVCGDGEPAELLTERLLPLVPSESFEIGDGDEVFAAVVFDPHYNPSGISSSPWDLYVIDATAAPQIDDSNPLGVPSDPFLGIDDLDDYRRVSEVPGSFRLYSGGSPEIKVVRCE